MGIALRNFPASLLFLRKGSAVKDFQITKETGSIKIEVIPKGSTQVQAILGVQTLTVKIVSISKLMCKICSFTSGQEYFQIQNKPKRFVEHGFYSEVITGHNTSASY